MFGRRRRARPSAGRVDPDLEWGISADLGDDFYPLPLWRHPHELEAEVVEILLEAVPEELGRRLDRARARVLAAEFRVMLAHAQNDEASTAALYRPALDAPMRALVTTRIHPPAPGTSLETWSWQVVVPPSADADVSSLRLPVGDAVRVHLADDPAVPTPAGSPGEDGAVLVAGGSVSHVFRAVSGQVVHHRTCWPHASAADEDLVALADHVAASLAYE